VHYGFLDVGEKMVKIGVHLWKLSHNKIWGLLLWTTLYGSNIFIYHKLSVV